MLETVQFNPPQFH